MDCKNACVVGTEQKMEKVVEDTVRVKKAHYMENQILPMQKCVRHSKNMIFTLTKLCNY